MEVYTSDSSDSDSRELKTLNFARLDLTPYTLDATLLQQLAMPGSHHQHNHHQQQQLASSSFYPQSQQLAPAATTSQPHFYSTSQHPPHHNNTAPYAHHNQPRPQQHPNLHHQPYTGISHADDIETLLLAHNRLNIVPISLARFNNLRVLDISANGLTELPDFLATLPLTSLIAKNNALTEASLPKTLVSRSGVLRELNLSGNRFERFPEQILELRGLKYLYLGGNKIDAIPMDVWKVQR